MHKEKEHHKLPTKTFSSKNNLKNSVCALPNNETKKAKTPSGTTNKVIRAEKKESPPLTNTAYDPKNLDIKINIDNNNKIVSSSAEQDHQENISPTIIKQHINVKKQQSSESSKKESKILCSEILFNLETEDESEASESVAEIKNLLQKNIKFVKETFLVLSADFNLQTVLSYAVEHLKVRKIIVLGHSNCCAMKTSLSNEYHGFVDNWLKPVKDLVEKNHEMLDKVMKKEPQKLITILAELNVKEQVVNLCKNPIIQKAWQDGSELFIHGLMLDNETGLIKDLKTMKKRWKPSQDINIYSTSKNCF